MNRMKSLLQSYYGVESDVANDAESEGLDSPHLDARKYAAENLRTKNLAEMLNADDTLVQETSSLDADMQLLVYDNYARFVHATDTIRSMKSKINQIDGEISDIADQLQNIGTASTEVVMRMAPKRSKIEKLVRLQNLVRKLNFLFELPSRLKQYIDTGEPKQAVFYYLHAIPILQKHNEVSSFASIECEAHQVMEKLWEFSLHKIEEEGLSHEEFHDSLSVIFDLKKQKIGTTETCGLSKRYIEWHKSYFENHIKSISSKSKSSALIEYVENMFDGVLEPLERCCASYCRIFSSNKENCTDDVSAGHQSDSELEKPNDLLKSFFNSVVKVLLSAIQGFLVDDNVTASSLMEGQRHIELLIALNVLIRRLDDFRRDDLIQDNTLHDRAIEIAESATRKQVVQSFEHLKETVTNHICHVFDQCNSDPEQTIEPPKFASELARGIEAEIRNTAERLESLVNESGKILSEMTAIFDNLITCQLRSWYLWLANALECFCDIYHPNRRFSLAPALSKQNRHSERCNIMVDVPRKSTSRPIFVLVLVCFTQELHIDACASSFGISGDHELTQEMGRSKNRLLMIYIDICATKVTAEIQSTLTESEMNICESEEAVCVLPFAINLVSCISKISDEVARSMRTNKISESSNVANDSTIDKYTANSVGLLPDQQSRYSRKLRYDRGSSSTQLDIERLFVKTIRISDDIHFTVESIVLGVLNVVLKTVFEMVRETTLSTFGFQQIEVNLHFLRLRLPCFLRDLPCTNNMIAIIFDAATERCLDPVRIDKDKIHQLCNAQRMDSHNSS